MYPCPPISPVPSPLPTMSYHAPALMTHCPPAPFQHTSQSLQHTSQPGSSSAPPALHPCRNVSAVPSHPNPPAFVYWRVSTPSDAPKRTESSFPAYAAKHSTSTKTILSCPCSRGSQPLSPQPKRSKQGKQASGARFHSPLTPARQTIRRDGGENDGGENDGDVEGWRWGEVVMLRYRDGDVEVVMLRGGDVERW